MKKVLFLMLFLSLWGTVCLKAQVTIGDNKTPEEFSVLELIGNGTGLRLPQLTTSQRDSLAMTDTFKDNPKALGLMVFNSDTKCVDYWNGDTWISQCAPTSINVEGGTIFNPNGRLDAGQQPEEIAGLIPPTGGTAPYTYEWQYCLGDCSNAGNWNPATGLCPSSDNTKASYMPCLLNNTTWFRRQVTDGGGNINLSNSVKLTVTLVAGKITQPDPLELGGGQVTIDGTARTGGLVSPVYYQWEYCTTGCGDDDNWYKVTDNTGGYGTGGFSCDHDGTGISYNSCLITSDMQVRRRDLDGEQAQVTNTVMVTVKTNKPTGTAADINASYTGGAVCQNSPASFTVSLVPSVTSPVIILYDSNGNPVDQSTSAPCTFTVNPGTAPQTSYFVAYKDANHDENLPAARKQVTIPVTAKLTPTISIAANPSGTITPGTQVTFTSTVNDLGGGSASYDWRVDGASVQTGPTSTYSSTTLTNGQVVSCILNVAGGCVTTSSTISNSLPVSVSWPPASPSCESCAAWIKSVPDSKSTYPYWKFREANGYCFATGLANDNLQAYRSYAIVDGYWVFVNQVDMPPGARFGTVTCRGIR